jgi:LysR family transcriptional regulator for metE and metH
MKSIPGEVRPSLEVRDLRIVLALAESGTTARAAAILHLTQPAVSRALLSIEDRLGTRLFERSPRGLSPTPAGQRLLTGAASLLAELGDLEHRVRAKTAAPLRLRLVCECYTAYHWMPSALQGLRASLPGVDLRIAIECTHDPLAALLAGDIDAALVSEAPTPRSRRLVDRPLFADEVVFVLAASHRLAARGTLARADLLGETLLTSRLPTRDMAWFHKPMAAARAAPLSYQVLPLTEAVVDFARAGMGIGVLSEWVAGPHLQRGDLVARRLATGPLRRPWRLVWRKEAEATATRLWQVLQHAAPRIASLPQQRARRLRA